MSEATEQVRITERRAPCGCKLHHAWKGCAIGMELLKSENAAYSAIWLNDNPDKEGELVSAFTAAVKAYGEHLGELYKDYLFSQGRL